jgi:hypothetical protein
MIKKDQGARFIYESNKKYFSRMKSSGLDIPEVDLYSLLSILKEKIVRFASLIPAGCYKEYLLMAQ